MFVQAPDQCQLQQLFYYLMLFEHVVHKNVRIQDQYQRVMQQQLSLLASVYNYVSEVHQQRHNH